jgi:hypothetical protein
MGKPYRELGSDYFDQRRPKATILRLIKRLELLGYSASFQQSPALASAQVFSRKSSSLSQYN